MKMVTMKRWKIGKPGVILVMTKSAVWIQCRAKIWSRAEGLISEMKLNLWRSGKLVSYYIVSCTIHHYYELRSTYCICFQFSRHFKGFIVLPITVFSTGFYYQLPNCIWLGNSQKQVIRVWAATESLWIIFGNGKSVHWIWSESNLERKDTF